MNITYEEALGAVINLGHATATAKNLEVEIVPLSQCVKRIAAQDVFSPIQTPSFDNSAMDGYAVSSILAAGASESTPVSLRVLGTIAAGDGIFEAPNVIGEDMALPCFEIMTGAAFPLSSGSSPDFDACVPYEQTQRWSGQVWLTRAPVWKQHRRQAGEDFSKGQLVVSRGIVLEPPHVMALASVGMTSVVVRKKLRALVFSTGSELMASSQSNASQRSSTVFDANGPFLEAVLREHGLLVEFGGVVADDADSLAQAIKTRVQSTDIDVVLTSGGISAGKFDYVHQAIKMLEASIVFHKVQVKPGHPVLFAKLDRYTHALNSHNVSCPQLSSAKIAFFALPGNPIACAAILRFLVVPYVESASGRPSERPLEGKIFNGSDYCELQPKNASVNGSTEFFKHGIVRKGSSNEAEVALCAEFSSSKISPFARSNCWVRLGRGAKLGRTGDVVECSSLCGSAPQLGL